MAGKLNFGLALGLNYSRRKTVDFLTRFNATIALITR